MAERTLEEVPAAAQVPRHLRELLTAEDETELAILADCLEDLPTVYTLESTTGEILRTELDEADLPRIREQLWRFMAWILGRGHALNLTAITTGLAIYERHILDSLRILPLLDRARTEQVDDFVDIGTGAGLPGLVLAIVRADLPTVLNDSLKKRLTFIDEVVADLGLAQVQTVHARAEDLGRQAQHREQHPVVLARAVAALPVLAEYCLPLLRPGGVWLAPKTLAESPDTMALALQKLGGGKLETWLPEPTVAGETEHCIYSVEKLGKTPRAYPRKAGTPSKKPLT